MRIVPENFTPFRQSPSRLPPQHEEVVRKQVEDWLKEGVVRPSVADSVSRVVLVKKKDNSFRICVDYRKLNSMVCKDLFPVPVVDDVLEKLQAAKYFSVMDLENGFFHVPIEESSKKFTAFITKNGTFEFNVAPFGFCNSPAVFIRFVNYIFKQLIFENVMELYVDDIIIFSETVEENLQKLKRVLDVASHFGLKIKWKKCSFLKTKIEFLGHLVEDGKIWPGREKVKAVERFPTPKDVKAVQSFLGLTGYFRKFIPNYARMAKPLTNLLRKDKVFTFGENERAAVQKLKAALTCEPVLKIYCRGAETEVHTDASKDGFGATLMQKFENVWHPIFFWSKRTTAAEEKQHSYILEIKAAYLALQKFRHYLIGVQFKLVTDCAAFKQTTTKKDIPRHVAQWILHFQDYDCTIEHRENHRMKHVDSLSRYPAILTITLELTERLKGAQQRDEHVQAIKEILKDRLYGDYVQKGELIYKTVDGNDLLVVPKSMEAEIIRDAHEVGHFGAQKTLHLIQQNYFIPHAEIKIQRHIKNCIRCIIYNKKLGKKEGYLNCINKGEHPLDTIHVDHLGPMDATSKLYKFILAVVDEFSKFVWLFPTKTTSCEEVINKLQCWVEVFGYPNRIISDKGTAFTAQAFRDFCVNNNVEHVLTTTGVPRGNGQIERVNRVILSVISKLSFSEPTMWYKYVGKVQQAINGHVSCSTKFTPFEVLFGVKMKANVNDALLKELHDEMLVNYDQKRQDLRQQVKQQIEKAQEAYKIQFDKKRKGEGIYAEGDLVAIKRTQFVSGKKLASEFIGPYKVTKTKRNGRYDVIKVGDFEGAYRTSTSCDNMKLWRYAHTNKDDLVSSESDDESDGRV